MRIHRASNQAGRGAIESNVAAIRRDVGSFRTIADRDPLGTDTGQCGHAGLQVTDEHIGNAVAVPSDQIVGLADKGDIPAIGSHDGAARGAIANVAIGADAHQDGCSFHQIADEYIRGAVSITGDQVARAALEGRIAAIGREVHGHGIIVATACPGQINAHQRGCSVGAVAQKDVQNRKNTCRDSGVAASQ